MFLRIPKKKEFLFLKEFHLKSNFLQECCHQISIEDSKEIVWENLESNHSKEVRNFLYVLKNVPKYHTFSYSLKANEKLRKSNSVVGYAIRLADFSSLDDYIMKQFSRNTRANLRRYSKRLENSFEITYNRYYGEITAERYQFLMNRLKEMLTRRFEERNDASDDLLAWGKLKANLLQLINNKQASLFVLGHKQVPLAMSICYHYGKTIFFSTPSHDIDFAKFGLGNTMLLKQVEWAFANEYKFFDMGWGKLDYKIRWCNYITMLENHVIFPKKSIPANILSVWEARKTRLNFLFKQTKESLKPLKRKKSNTKISSYEFVDYAEIDVLTETYVPINPGIKSHAHFKPILIDFIYRFKERHSNVVLYKTTKNPILYIIQGKEHIKKVVLYGVKKEN